MRHGRITNRTLSTWVGLSIVLTAFLCVRLRFLDSVPIWDSRVYFDELIEAVRHPFVLHNYALALHSTYVFTLLLSLPQHLDPESSTLINATMIALGVIAIIFFYRVLDRVVPDQQHGIERVLATSIFALHPIVLATNINYCPDFGILLFFLVCLDCLLRERFWLATFAGIGMVFSKEMGFVIYVITLALYYLFFVHFSSSGRRNRFGFVVQRFYLGAPVLAFLAYIFANPDDVKKTTTFFFRPFGGLTNLLFSLDLTDRHFIASLAGIFVINFGWVLVVLGFAPLAAFVAKGRASPIEETSPPIRHRDHLFFLALLFILFVALTRFKSFLNLRYYLPLYPLLILVASLSVMKLSVRRAVFWRRLLLATSLALMAMSSFRTVDPIAKAIFGTFSFGKHPLLSMTSITRENSGHGRDQLVYNTEFTRFETLQDRVYEVLRPDADTVILFHPDAYWFFTGALDRTTFHRTTRSTSSFTPLFATVADIAMTATRPPEVFYIVLPNLDSRRDLALLNHLYATVDIQRVMDADGYSLQIIHFIDTAWTCSSRS